MNKIFTQLDLSEYDTYLFAQLDMSAWPRGYKLRKVANFRLCF